MSEKANCPYCGWPVEDRSELTEVAVSSEAREQVDSLMLALRAIVVEGKRGGLLPMSPTGAAVLEAASHIVEQPELTEGDRSGESGP